MFIVSSKNEGMNEVWHSNESSGSYKFAKLSWSGDSFEVPENTIVSDTGGGGDFGSRITWNNNTSEFGVVWSQYLDGVAGQEIEFMRLNSYGETQGSIVRLTNDSVNSDWPNIYCIGADYGITWRHQGDEKFVRTDSSGDQTSPILDISASVPVRYASDGSLWTMIGMGLIIDQITCP